MTRRFNSVLGMKARRASDDDHFHRTMRQKLFDVGERRAAVFCAKLRRFVRMNFR